MLGDAEDMARRMRAVLPTGWFASTAPVLDLVLGGLGVAMSAVYGLIQFTRQQARLMTATDGFIESFACDFFGNAFRRRLGELDLPYAGRVKSEILRPRATRIAVSRAVQDLCGQAPLIFEPKSPSDTGGYNLGGCGYGCAGGWGNLSLPFQFFLTLHRPTSQGIALLAGYGTGGYLSYGSISWEVGSVSDLEIYDALARLLPAGAIAWCRLLS